MYTRLHIKKHDVFTTFTRAVACYLLLTSGLADAFGLQELIDGLQLMDRANGKGTATKHSILLAVREHDLQVGGGT